MTETRTCMLMTDCNTTVFTGTVLNFEEGVSMTASIKGSDNVTLTYDTSNGYVGEVNSRAVKAIGSLPTPTHRSVFTDQRTFMIAGEQTVDKHNPEQYKLYLDLIDEEYTELKDAIAENNTVKQLDGLIDMLVVTIGALHSLGADAEGAWNEVIRSNMSKVDPATGKLLKRPDGKVLKPETYSPPQLETFVLARDN